MASLATISQATAFPSRAPRCRRNLFSAPKLSHTLRGNTIATSQVASTNGAAEDLKGLLSRFDSDGDGRLTIEEVQQAFAAMQVRATRACDHGDADFGSQAGPGLLAH